MRRKLLLVFVLVGTAGGAVAYFRPKTDASELRLPGTVEVQEVRLSVEEVAALVAGQLRSLGA